MKVDFVSQLNTGNNEKLTTFKGHYVNPNKEFKELGVGADVSLNRKWSTGSNLTLILPNIQNISIDGTLKLPSKEFHEAKGKLFYTTPIDHVEFLAKYNTELSRKNYAVNGTAHITVSGCFFFHIFYLIDFFSQSEGENNRIKGNFGVEWAPNKGVDNIVEYAEVGEGYDLIYKLSTPKYKNKKALVFNGNYRTADLYHKLT